MADTNLDDIADTVTDSMTADDAKAFFAQAQTKVTEAIHAAIDAAKENPKTAAAIATGAAAAIGAAAYGITKLREDEPKKPAARKPAAKRPAARKPAAKKPAATK